MLGGLALGPFYAETIEATGYNLCLSSWAVRSSCSSRISNNVFGAGDVQAAERVAPRHAIVFHEDHLYVLGYDQGTRRDEKEEEEEEGGGSRVEV